MDEVYHRYRISIFATDQHWRARITHVRGNALSISATATLEDGPDLCMQRARKIVDEYIAFLQPSSPKTCFK